jgi:hypothetical protein
MLQEVVAVEPIDSTRLRVLFDDGVGGVVDVAAAVTFTGVFAPLADPSFFVQVRVGLGTAVWPNGADIAPETLYALATGHRLDLQPGP